MMPWILALALSLQQETPIDPVKPGAPGKKPDVVVGLRAGVELSYDDNVTMLNEEDVQLLEDGLRPDKFRIDEPDDFITSPWVETTLKAPLFAEPTTFGLRAQANVYSTNSVKDYQEFLLFAKQRLSPHGTLGLEYEFIPEFYRREYRVPSTGIFDSAFYAQHDFKATYRHQFAPVVAIRPEAGLRLRDYDSPFDHRDSTSVILAFRGEVEPLEWLEARVELKFESLEAEASSQEPDISHVEHSIEPGVIVKPLPGLAFELKYRVALRRYTTSNSAAVDPGHRDREDQIDRATIGASYRFNPHWEVEAEVELTRQDSDRPFEPGASDEETTYERNVFTLGVTWRM